MTNVVQSNLLKLIKITLKKSYFISKYSTRSYYELINGTGCSICRVQFKHSNLLNNARFLSATSSGKHYDGEKFSDQGESVNENNDDKPQDRYSSSFHQNHRKAYEHKRSNYQQNNTRDGTKSTSNSDLGIQMNHYQRLNIDTDADQNTIKTAYYSLSKIYHPDIVGPHVNNSAENFRLITESYDVLSDPKQRESYDKELIQSTKGSDSINLHWTKPGHPNKDFKIIFKCRDADSMFRFRQDTEIEIEKKKNPKKFQAGSFGNTSSVDYDDERLIEQRISSLRKRMFSLNRSKKNDETEFYRMHLYDSISRKHNDLIEAQTLHKQAKSSGSLSSDTAEILSLLCVLGFFIGLLIVILNIFVDIDIANYLDKRFDDTINGEEEKADSSPKGRNNQTDLNVR